MCKSINKGQELENFNVGLVNIEDENNYSGISGWVILEYSTFFIICNTTGTSTVGTLFP